MRNWTQLLIASTCLSMLASPALAQDGPVLKIENFIGTIDVKTGNYDKITITDADGVNYDRVGAGISIDNDESTRNINCNRRFDTVTIGSGRWTWGGRKGGSKDLKDYPSVKITAPENTHLVLSDSITFGTVGTIGSGDIHVRSCGDLKMADVNGDLDLRVSGSGDVKMGNAGNSDISISGSGDLIGGNFASLELSVSGSGDAEIGNIIGMAHIHSSGSGDIEARRMEGGLDYSGSGSSDITADYVSGDLTAQSSGSGDVSIDDGEVQTLYLSASGAANIDYDGTSINAEARATGGSNISIRRPSGELITHDSAGGDVNIHG